MRKIAQLQGHDLLALDEPPESVAHCSCGWRSAPAWSLRHAEERWRIHTVERRAADSYTTAINLQDEARRRKVELVALREATVERRWTVLGRRLGSGSGRRGAAASAPKIGADAALLLDRARLMAGITVTTLWCDFVALGGDAPVNEFAEMLRGDRAMQRFDHDVTAQALNERFAEAGFGYPIEYWGDPKNSAVHPWR